MKPKVILYDDIDQKKIQIQESAAPYAQEALVRALDLLDFNAALSSQNDQKPEPVHCGIKWIELKWAAGHG